MRAWAKLAQQSAPESQSKAPFWAIKAPGNSGGTLTKINPWVFEAGKARLGAPTIYPRKLRVKSAKDMPPGKPLVRK